MIDSGYGQELQSSMSSDHYLPYRPKVHPGALVRYIEHIREEEDDIAMHIPLPTSPPLPISSANNRLSSCDVEDDLSPLPPALTPDSSPPADLHHFLAERLRLPAGCSRLSFESMASEDCLDEGEPPVRSPKPPLPRKLQVHPEPSQLDCIDFGYGRSPYAPLSLKRPLIDVFPLRTGSQGGVVVDDLEGLMRPRNGAGSLRERGSRSRSPSRLVRSLDLAR